MNFSYPHEEANMSVDISTLRSEPLLGYEVTSWFFTLKDGH